MFRSLGLVNYRLWFLGALVSNIGFWMQRAAQDWIVLTELTDYDAAALGLTLALQTAPQVLMLPISGLVADRFDRRRILLATNSTMAVLAAGLGSVVLLGVVELWHVYAFALAGGITSAIDNPAKHGFVSELVAENRLGNAVALNAASFNTARTIGPAAAAGLVLLIGPGLVFMINAVTFGALILALLRMRKDQLNVSPQLARGRGNISGGFRYVSRRPDIQIVMVVVFLMGALGLNFAIFTSTMTTIEFGLGVGEYGLLLSCLAVGAVVGALLSARRDSPQLRFVILGAVMFGTATALGAVMPNYWTFAAAIFLVGVSTQTVLTTANGLVQLSTPPHLRGRVLAMYVAVLFSGTPIGAPIVGAIANDFGPRAAMGVAAAAGLMAALIAVVYVIRAHEVRLRYERSARLRFAVSHSGPLSRARIAEQLAVNEATAKSN